METSDNIDEYNAFVELHRAQLRASAVPEHLWYTVFIKMRNETFDAGNSFLMAELEDGEMTVVMKLANGMSPYDVEHVYLIDHAWTFETREALLQLRSVPGLLKRISNLIGLNSEFDTAAAAEQVFQDMWKFLRTYSQVVSADEPPVTFWYVLDEFGSTIKHSSEPNFRAVPFFYQKDKTAYTLLFPIKEVDENEQVLIDFVEGAGNDDSSSREALLVPWTEQSFIEESPEQNEPDEEFFLAGAQKELIPENLKPMPPQPAVLKVFSEYQRVNEFLTAPGFEIAESEDEADILWLTRHFTDYADLNRTKPGTFINQFPFERVVTTKDLLSIVARRGGYPDWLPLTYNLVTELPKFVGVFQRRDAAKQDNHWICKPWNLARAIDTTVTNNLDCILRLPFSGPKIAQKYAERPVLFRRENIGNVKFDVRYVVLLESVAPLKLYAYKKFFLRFANKAFELRDLWDYEKHFTVMNYREDSSLYRMLCDDFVPAFEEQFPQQKWELVEKKILNALKDVFSRACNARPPRGIADFPQSRALYAADLLLHWKGGEMEPLLLEVNYGPDCDRACDYYPDFYNDIFNMFFKKVYDTTRFHVL